MRVLLPHTPCVDQRQGVHRGGSFAGGGGGKGGGGGSQVRAAAGGGGVSVGGDVDGTKVGWWWTWCWVMVVAAAPKCEVVVMLTR